MRRLQRLRKARGQIMRKTIPTLGVVSAGLLLAGSPAQAIETDMTTAINVGIANGIQANLPIQVPVNICGNAIGILGTASAYCTGSATANYAVGHRHNNGYGGDNHPSGGDTDMLSAINVGIADGIQADALVQVPVNVCGNAIAVLGDATAGCTSTGATANAFTHGNHDGNGGPNGVYGRTLVPAKALPTAAPAKAKPLPTKLRVSAAKPRKTEVGLLANLLQPVTGLLSGGDRNTNGGGNGNHDHTCGNVNMTSLGNVGIANGIQAHAPIQIPVNFSGNAIAVGGSATASSTGGATANYC
ncbi:MAG TPA: hypothetical protein DGT23_35390 [Micromonosporaceae bacterium]|nr:hypothetical protein [Micromonosporaceae bacterium]